MADSFDLLDELGDEKKVGELKARIQQKKASDVISKLDNIESEIENAAANNKSAEDIVSGIINAKFESLNGDVQSTEKDLQELMLHLRAMLDSCGGEFANLQELNKGELNLVANAKSKLTNAERELAEANAMSNAWNILFGMKTLPRRSPSWTRQACTAPRAPSARCSSSRPSRASPTPTWSSS